MKVKELFENIRRGRKEAIRLRATSEGLYTRLMNTHKELKEIQVQSSLQNNRENLILDALEIQEELNKRMAFVMRETLTFFRLLNMVSDEQKRGALQLYYIGDLKTDKVYTYEEVAEKISYSCSHTRKLISEGLQEIERKC